MMMDIVFSSLNLVLCVLSAHAFFMSKGVLTPDNPYVFIGDILNLTCELTDTFAYPGNVSHLLSITTMVDEMETALPREYITYPDSRSIHIEYPVSTKEDQGGYSCLVDGTFVASQVVTVEHRPERIDELVVSVYDWTTMIIRWELNQDYVNPDRVRSHLNYTINGLPNQVPIDCPSSGGNSCTWDSPPPNVYVKYNVYITVMTQNSSHHMTDSTTSVFVVNPMDYVKPSPVTHLTPEDKNSTCISAAWQVSEMSQLEGVICAVDIDEKQIRTTLTKAVICDLRPATTYNLSVACRPKNEFFEYGLYSEPNSILITTHEDVPSGTVVMAPSSFRYHECFGTNTCNLSIYWQPVPEGERNGEITSYQVRVSDHHRTITVPGSANHVTLELLKDRDHLVEVTAGTNIGYSEHHSMLTTPAFHTRPPAPDQLLVERDADTVYVSWIHPQDTVTGYTLYYCSGSTSTLVCEDEIQWVNLSSLNTSYMFKPPGGIIDNVMIGISSESDRNHENESSGISWSHCTYMRYNKPAEPDNVHFSEEQPGGALSVSWQRVICPVHAPYVTRYILTYCKWSNNACIGPSYNESVENNVDSHVIKDLEIWAKYQVTLRAVSRSGEGPASDPIISDPVQEALLYGLSKSGIAGISVGGVFFFVLLLAVAVFVGRRIRRSYKEKIDIQLPRDLFKEEPAPDLPYRNEQPSTGIHNTPTERSPSPEETLTYNVDDTSGDLGRTRSADNEVTAQRVDDTISSSSNGSSATSTSILLQENRGKAAPSLHVTIPAIGSTEVGMTNPGYVTMTDSGESHTTVDSYSKMGTQFTPSPVGSPISQVSDSSQAPLINPESPLDSRPISNSEHATNPLSNLSKADQKAIQDTKFNTGPVQNSNYVTWA